ncbi:MAG TPA: tetratricopeptide repeat protein [Vicinamibacterales bacterium]
MRRRDAAIARGFRPSLWLVAFAMAIVGSACGGKPTVAPAATVGAVRFPDFIFPAAPASAGSEDLATRQASAWQILQSGDARAADREFAAVLKAAPAFYPAAAGQGYAALARKDNAAALAHFDKALAANTTYAPALAGKGDALAASGRTDAAVAAYEAALAADTSLTPLRARVDALKFRNAQEIVTNARKAADAGRVDEARSLYANAIAASPESAFLHRELADVERRAGNADAAVAQAQQAARLDPADTRALMLIAEIQEAGQQWAKAADAYAAVNALEPSEAVAAKTDQMRQNAALEAMPEEYRGIHASPTVTRAQLAALLGVHLESLLRGARASNAVVTTDTRTNWAAPWIMAVTRAGVMDAFPNHTFQPGATLRRSDLASAASRVLTLIARDNPKLAAQWRDPRPRFSDLSPGNLSYPAAARSVSAGVMASLDGETFQLARPVTGVEALDVVTKLEALARR